MNAIAEDQAETEDKAEETALTALFDAAVKARDNAYAPYSHFSVGAALRTPAGEIFSGANVENAAYPVGICAEAAAISAMIAAGAREISEIVVIADCGKSILPCGACRQRIGEFATDDALVYSAGPDGVRGSIKFADLFPQKFDRETLVGDSAIPV